MLTLGRLILVSEANMGHKQAKEATCWCSY